MKIYTTDKEAAQPSEFFEDAARLIWKEIQTNPAISMQFIQLWMLRAALDAQTFKSPEK